VQACLIEPFTEQQARAAGVALARSGSRDLIDAAVVTAALERNDMIVTSDPDDLRRIASALGRSVELYVPD
jgi:predicted nucleic acid-binding protein